MLRQLWTGAQSTYLTETPDLSNAKNLEAINLFYCVCLVKLHPSIKDLPKLESLWLESCYSLCEVPSPFCSKVLKVVSLYGLTQLKTYPKFESKLQRLRLSVSDIEGVPECDDLIFFRDVFLEKDLMRSEIQQNSIPKSVKQLNLLTTDIEEVPSFIQSLLELESLCLRDNKNLKSISSSISGMESLYVLQIVNCELLSSIPELPVSLKALQVVSCASLKTVAAIRNDSKLRSLRIMNCSQLDEEACRNITQHALRKIQSGEGIHFVLTCSQIPEWFTQQTVGSCLTIPLPSDHDRDNSLIGLALCVVLEPNLTPSASNRNGFSLDSKPHVDTIREDEAETDDDSDAVIKRVKVEINLDIYGEPFTADHMVMFSTSVSNDEERDPYSTYLFQFYSSKVDCAIRKCGAYPMLRAELMVVD